MIVGSTMTLAALRKRAYPLLADAPRADAAIEFRVLLATALATTPTAVAAMRAQEPLAARVCRWVMRAAQKRRRRGLSLAHLIGYKEFYGLRFAVSRATLIPRPESELLVDLVCQLARTHGWRRVHDCGTGSGCVAIAIHHAAATPPPLQVSASDISSAALRIARKNCRTLLGSKTAILWQHGSTLRPLLRQQKGTGRATETEIDAIVANLPYLHRSELHEPSIRCEPRRALHGRGALGTRVIERVIREAAELLTDRGALLLECAPQQVARLCALLARHQLPRTTIHRDLAGQERVIVARKAVHPVPRPLSPAPHEAQ